VPTPSGGGNEHGFVIRQRRSVERRGGAVWVMFVERGQNAVTGWLLGVKRGGWATAKGFTGSFGVRGVSS
jgi:hypothetical protein